ncbi:MAG: DUF2235 domain-containing protein [Acidobacteriota bacterium]
MGLYAFDGTWNTEKTRDNTNLNTNVVRFKNAYQHNAGQEQFYVSGVGTRLKWLGRAIGGAFGAGELPRLNEAYDKLCENWVNGHDEIIDIVGFSRGAATTLDFCHLVQERGIRQPGTDTVVVADPPIRFLGVWDVVPAFGLGFFGNQALNFGHKLTLPTRGIEYCFHALALDERRLSFIPTRLNGAYEVWFRGVHSDIGGGNGNLGLNDISLKWMMSKAQAAGLPISDDDIEALNPDPRTSPNDNPKLPNIRNIGPADLGHYTAEDRGKWRSMPTGSPIETPADEVQASRVGAGGISTLPEAMRRRAEMMWDVAVRRATDQHHVVLDNVEDPFLALIAGRAAIVNDQNLNAALLGTITMIDGMMKIAREMGFGQPAPVFLNLALQQNRHVFPYTN